MQVFGAFVVVFAFCAITWCLSPEDKEFIAKINKECQAETGVADDVLEKAMKGEFPDDPKLKENIFCFAKKSGMQNEAGEFQMDHIKTMLGEKIQDAGLFNEVMKCFVQKGSPQDTAFETAKCMCNLIHDA